MRYQRVVAELPLDVLFLIFIELAIVIGALVVIVTGLRAIRADIQRLIDVQQRPSPGAR